MTVPPSSRDDFFPPAESGAAVPFRQERRRPLPRRLRWFLAGAVLSCGVLAGRLLQIQFFQRDDFSAGAQRQRIVTETIPAAPGEVVDRRGRVLATSVLTRSLYVIPRRLNDPAKEARRLAGALHLDAGGLTRRLLASRRKQFLWIKRRLSAAEEKAVRALRLPRAVYGFREEYRRYYPQGKLAVHVIGLRNIDNRGRGGIEEAFDDVLRGRAGRRFLLRDARGRVVEVLEEQGRPPQPGQTVQLTLDMVLQLDVEEEMDRLMQRWRPKAAGIILMDPRNGEILAMSSRPDFDPNQPAPLSPLAWKNFNIAAVFEPGSTFKPFVVAWALQRGVIQREEMFDCEWGRYQMGRRLLHDHHPYGRLSVKDILVKSSNIGMAKIGQRLTNAGLYQAAVRFGFGRRTGCGLPGEVEGLLRPLSEWTDYSTGSVPMGQELAVTPLQLITAHAALANGGKLISPHLVQRVSEASSVAKDDELSVPPSLAPVVTRTVSSDIARWIVQEAMTDVVRRGTGKRARLPGYAVFGKTGTAQKIDPQTGRYGRRHVCSFVGGAPAHEPRLLVLVVVDEPSAAGMHYGGTVAAPTAARILQRALLHLGIPTVVRRGATTGRR